MLALLVGYCALFGLVVGSFLNVVIYRVPRKESDRVAAVGLPDLRCPHRTDETTCPSCPGSTCGDGAGTVTPPFRCAIPSSRPPRPGSSPEWRPASASPGPSRPISCWRRDCWPWPAPTWNTCCSRSGSSTRSSGLSASSSWWRPPSRGTGTTSLVAVISGAVWFAIFFAMNFISPRALGFGDVRLAPVLGLALGWLGVRYVLLGFFAANLIGAVIGIALIASKRMSRQQQIPYGVFLAVGTLLAIFAGPELLRPFHSLRV